MNTSLAEKGLPELVLTAKVTEGTMGVDSIKVQNACEQLDMCVANINGFIEELTTQYEAILNGWEGEAANTLREYFPEIIEAFGNVPKSVKSISDWATSTKNKYVASDMAVADSIKHILGGRR